MSGQAQDAERQRCACGAFRRDFWDFKRKERPWDVDAWAYGNLSSEAMSQGKRRMQVNGQFKMSIRNHINLPMWNGSSAS